MRLASFEQTRAILWAQWRSLRNFLPRRGLGGLALSGFVSVMLYGGFAALSLVAIVILRSAGSAELRQYLSLGLFFLFLYWQVMPLFLAANGLSLEMKKLLPYPIPTGALFGLEALLRLSVSFETVLVLGGAFLGVLLNPTAPLWGSLWLIAFAAFNLLLSVGIRDLLVRLLARKGVREIAAFLLVMLAVAPRLIAYRLASHEALPGWVKTLRAGADRIPWPWTTVARLASGHGSWWDAAALAGWIAAAYFFARAQFNKAIQTEQSESARSAPPAREGRAGVLEGFYRFPSLLWRDPVAAIVEKELRTLSRSSRFRLLFLMGFSFGLIVWMPLSHQRHGFVGAHFLTAVSVYAVLLLSDPLFCNSLGFDRSAAQFYFVAPAGLRAALKGKNLTAVVFLFLEITAVALACFLLRFPIGAGQLFESYAVAAILALLLLILGNYSSLLQPRPSNPANAFRNSTGGNRVQIAVLIAFPLAALPIGLAYLAGYAFDNRLAFFGVLAIEGAIGLIVYRLGLDSVVARAERNCEAISTALSQGSGPITST